jgi:hypothetical protein
VSSNNSSVESIVISVAEYEALKAQTAKKEIKMSFASKIVKFFGGVSKDEVAAMVAAEVAKNTPQTTRQAAPRSNRPRLTQEQRDQLKEENKPVFKAFNDAFETFKRNNCLNPAIAMQRVGSQLNLQEREDRKVFRVEYINTYNVDHTPYRNQKTHYIVPICSSTGENGMAGKYLVCVRLVPNDKGELETKDGVEQEAMCLRWDQMLDLVEEDFKVNVQTDKAGGWMAPRIDALVMQIMHNRTEYAKKNHTIKGGPRTEIKGVGVKDVDSKIKAGWVLIATC